MKWLKSLLGTVLVSLLCVWSVQAQEAFIEQIQNPGIDHNQAVKEFGAKFATGLFNNDLNNLAVIYQMENYNEAILNQVGTSNVGIMNMIGNNNFSDVNQEGSQLFANVNMIGNNNWFDFDQSGHSVGALFNFIGNNMEYEAEQRPSFAPGKHDFSLTPRNGSHPVIDITTTRPVLPVIIRRH